MLDIKIVNGTIVDGAGSPARKADLGIKDGLIEAIADLSTAESAHTIDATGSIVTPGFIDIHSHSDHSVFEYPSLDSKLRQGVTTEVTGNCGHSAAPYDPAWRESTSDQYPWHDPASFFSWLEVTGTGANIAMLAGHGNLRMAVIGPSSRAASAEDLKLMRTLLAECLDQGCAGLSSGLIYPPGQFASTEELVSLASVLSSEHFYSTHIRNESSLLFDALNEAFITASQSSQRLEVSHLKACGKDVWGRIPEALSLFEAHESQGLDVSFDAYPYTATQTGIRQLFPPWTQDGGRLAFVARLRDRSTRAKIIREILSGDISWENILVSAGPDNIVIGATKSGRYEGKSLTEIATDMGIPAIDAACEVALAEDGEAGIITFEMNPVDVEMVLSHRLCSICSDGSGYSDCHSAHVHPRNYAAFAWFLSEYVLGKKLVTLEEGIRKMTSFPASRARTQNRGSLLRGYCADVLVIDPEIVRANADFRTPRRYATGFKTVIVNGKVAVNDDRLTGIRAGQVLRY